MLLTDSSGLPLLGHEFTSVSVLLVFVYAGCRLGIVTIATPGGMVEVDHKVAVIGDNGVVESQFANTSPVAEGPLLQDS
jgi:hypothetical protein